MIDRARYIARCEEFESRYSGFTLIELMVALGLSAIISVSIMMISSQARMSYDETVKKVDVYNRFRYAFRSIEEDLQNWIPTSDMEFYQDGTGRNASLNGHWDPGEETQDSRDQLGPGARDGGVYDNFDEFAFIEQGHYKSREPQQKDEKVHDAYRIYFQTLTYVGGAMRLANVEYALVDPRLPRRNGSLRRPEKIRQPKHVADLTLVKTVRYFHVTPDMITNVNKVPSRRTEVEVATNVTDFRLEYAADAAMRSRRSAKLTLYTPEMEFRSPVEKAVRPEFTRRDRVFRKRFGYGSVKLGVRYPRGTAYPGIRGDRNIGSGAGDHKPTRFGFQGDPTMQFSQLVPGDKIYVFTEASRAGGGGSSASTTLRLIQFPSGDYTVKANMGGLLEFDEDIDSTNWNAQTQSGLLYKAAYLPAAVRITMRIVDDKGENPKTLQKVIWIRRRNR